MKNSIVRLCLIACCLFVGSRAPFAQPEPDTTTIRGQVVDDKGLPIGGASVTLQRPMQIGGMAFWGGVTYTDAHGDFAFEDAEEGTYRLTIDAAGFAAIQNPSQVIGDDTSPLHFAMQGLGTLPFRLLGPDGKLLTARQVSMALFSPEQQLSQNPMAGGDGVARLSSVVPGTYRVESIVPEVGYAIVDSLQVKSGLNPTVDLNYKQGGALRVLATTTEGGKEVPAGGMVVSFSRVGAVTGPSRPQQQWMFALGENGRFSRITRDGDGSATFANLPPGEYEVSGTVPGGFGIDGANTPVKSPNVQVTAGGTIDAHLQFPPAAAGSAHILVTVLHSDGKPAADIDVPLMAQQFDAPAGNAEPRNRRGLLNQIERRGHTDAAGQFDIYPIAPGHWQIRAIMGERGEGRAGIPSVDVTAAKPASLTLDVR